jgi:hypothetical protein
VRLHRRLRAGQHLQERRYVDARAERRGDTARRGVDGQQRQQREEPADGGQGAGRRRGALPEPPPGDDALTGEPRDKDAFHVRRG